MTSPFGPMRLIVNPRAGRGAVAKTLPVLRAALDRHGLVHDVVETTASRSAVEAARTALGEGIRYLVAVGGDGTVHEVVNGMFDGTTPIAPDAVLGVAGAGSGCDFIKTFGLDRKPETVAKHLAGDEVMPIDVGVMDHVDLDGNPATCLFANIAEVGFGADVVRRVERYPRFLGRVRYLVGAYMAMAAAKLQEATVTVSHTDLTVPVCGVVIANGQFFGGGMKVAPRALPDDGRLNVQVYAGGRSQIFLLTTKIYRGEHLPDPEIFEYQSPIASLAPDIPMPLEADGEYLGTTPASFRLLDKALRLKI